MAAAKLNIRDLSVEAGSGKDGWRRVVHNISLSVKPGDVVALIGESGAGKTTIALTALGYTRTGTRVTGGSVAFGNLDVLALSRAARNTYRGRQAAYVAQSAPAALNPSMTIGAQIRESLHLHGVSDGQGADSRADQVLRALRLPDPKSLMKRRPGETSGGQQQRVMIGIAMACRPRLLVFDEPTTALDVTTQIGVLQTIKKAIAEQNDLAAIYVSHDLAVVAQIATRIIVLKDGHVIEEGPTEEIISSPKEAYTRELLAAVKTIPRNFHQPSAEKLDEEPLLRLRAIDASYHKPTWFRPPAESQKVLRDIAFNLARGETLAVVGESGSGKTTLARVIAGLHAPIAGTIELSGRPIDPLAARRDKDQLRRIQIVFQSPEQALNPRATAGESIARVLRFYFNMPVSDRGRRIAELLNMVDLPADFAGKLPHELSGGQRQRVAIARAFAAEPDIIVCDEFLSALDTIVASRIIALMADLQKQKGASYIFISHDLATVATISHRVAVMYGGRIVEQGRASGIFRAQNHPYTTLLVRSVPQLRTDWLDDVTAQGIDPDGTPLIDLGCPFRNRCSHAMAGVCDRHRPPIRSAGRGHKIECHLELDQLPRPLLALDARWSTVPASGLSRGAQATGKAVRRGRPAKLRGGVFDV